MTDPMPFQIQAVRPRGMGQLGMVANINITKGTRILAEAPIIRLPPADDDSGPMMRACVGRQLEKLDQDKRRAYLELFSAFEGDLLLNIAKTNALPLDADTGESGVFLLASSIHHDCVPNAQNSWNSNLARLTVHAVKDIREGEEITVSCLDEVANSEMRSHFLQERLRFTCTCPECSLPKDQLEESDKRWEEMKDMQNAIKDGAAMMAIPLVCLGMIRRVLSLLDQCGIQDLWVARAYNDAFLLASNNGDQARASVFAKRAAANILVCEGSDHPRWQKITAQAADPTSRDRFGLTARWKTRLDQVPRDRSEQKFEEWLWDPNSR